MIQQKIFEIVSSIAPVDALEEKHQQETLEWIRKPDIPNKHLVSYFILFDKNAEKILLVDHKKAQLWLPTGGHVELDEHPEEAVRRECMEELGIAAEFFINHPLFITSTKTVGLTAGHTDVSLWYILKGDSTKTYAFDKEEFNTIRWFSLKDLPYEKSDPHMVRFVKKLLNNFTLKNTLD